MAQPPGTPPHTPPPDDPDAPPGAREEHILPVVEERARVDVAERVVGRVRVATRSREEEVAVAETLRSSRVEIERVARDVYVDEAPAVVERDGVTIIPVLEEVLVRRLVLREEIHLRRVEEEREVRDTVVLRTQEPVIERDGPGD